MRLDPVYLLAALRPMSSASRQSAFAVHTASALALNLTGRI